LFKLHLCIVHKNEYHYNYLLQKQQLKKEQEEKIKEEKKLAKIKAKQLEIKAKQLEIKEKKNKNILKCSQITKKGNQCSFISFKDGLCKMHSKTLEQGKTLKQGKTLEQGKTLNSNV
jgi:Fe-S-cluster containining protein